MLIEKAGAKTAGAGIVIEKAYQGGGNLVRDMGIRVESLAKIKSISKKTESCSASSNNILLAYMTFADIYSII